MNTTRLTIRLSEDQLAYLRKIGRGDASVGVRQVIALMSGIGPVDLPRGMAAVDDETRARVASAGGVAKNRKV